MHRLEKFQQSEKWRAVLKNFLTKNNRTVAQINSLSNPKRYSLDIDEDLKTILEEKKIPKKMEEKDKDPLYCPKKNINEDSGKSTFHGIDESFEVLEKMCDKTASDPDSTLFQYIHSDQKDIVIAKAKKRSAQRIPSQHISGEEAEEAALERLLNELAFKEEIELLESDKKNCFNVDITQLDDIEAPSRLWDNTVGDTILQTSPVKMVGLLRPSTIIEEIAEESNCSEEYSQSVSCYETAHDSTAVSITSKYVKEEHEASKGSAERTIFQEYRDTNDERNLNLIDLDNTYVPVDKVVEDKSETESEESIEIISDEEEDDITSQIPDLKKVNENDSSIVSAGACSLINTFNYTLEEDKENLKVAEEQLPNFNDTMEEVEYMMKKGMEYMAAAAALETSEHTVAKEVPKSVLKELPVRTSPKPSSPYFADEKPTSRFALNIKPFKNLDIFKKPVGSAIPISTTKRHVKDGPVKPFSHIVSPLRTYMKHTSTTPLMTTMKNRNKAVDVMNSTAFQQLEYESRLCQPTFREAIVTNLPDSKGIPRSLPKKAYISSQFKHIVDERTPVTIPGGRKIQKYIESAMLPSVVRHDGKLKFPSNTDNGSASAHNSGRNNESMADLSVMSGEVSMYTIMDAQKF